MMLLTYYNFTYSIRTFNYLEVPIKHVKASTSNSNGAPSNDNLKDILYNREGYPKNGKSSIDVYIRNLNAKGWRHLIKQSLLGRNRFEKVKNEYWIISHGDIDVGYGYTL